MSFENQLLRTQSDLFLEAFHGNRELHYCDNQSQKKQWKFS